jgi:hypothetical protein
MSFNSVFSIYIPHVFPNFDREYMTNVFEKYGTVSQVDFVTKQDRLGKDFNAVYVHFSCLKNESFKTCVEKGAENGGIQILHDEPWYWIVLPNKAKKHIPGDRKPRIDLGDASVIRVSDFVTPEKIPLTRSETIRFPIKNYAEALDTMINSWTDTQREFTLDMEEENDLESSYSFDADDEVEQIYNEMDEIEAEIQADDANLVLIDGRYIKTLELESLWLTNEVAQLRATVLSLNQLYQIECAKVRALNVPHIVNIIPNDENV